MWRFYAAEFEAENERLARDGSKLVDAESARQYFRSRGVPVWLVTLEQCRRVKPRFLASCGSGPLVYAKVPVTNTVCRIYRDDAITVQLRYGERGQWTGQNTDMAPFKSLPNPFTRRAIDWGR